MAEMRKLHVSGFGIRNRQFLLETDQIATIRQKLPQNFLGSGDACWPMFMFRASSLDNKNEKGRAAMRVIGIDPGLRATGWGVVEVDGARLFHVANGTCRTGAGDLADRLLALHEQLFDVFQHYVPTEAAVEQTFVNSNGAATLKLGQARAIALLVPAQAGLRVAEYAPNTVKKVVVGVGHAHKD